MSAKKLKQLQSQSEKIHKQIAAILERQAERKAARLIGRHFKVRTSYSCAKTHADYWTVYFKVLRYGDGGIYAMRIEQDAHGRIVIEPNRFVPLNYVVNCLTPTAPVEFHREMRRLYIKTGQAYSEHGHVKA